MRQPMPDVHFAIGSAHSHAVSAWRPTTCPSLRANRSSGLGQLKSLARVPFDLRAKPVPSANVSHSKHRLARTMRVLVGGQVSCPIGSYSCSFECNGEFRCASD